MARRKRILDDSDSDSSVGSDSSNVDSDNDPDLRDERELFRDPYRRKRRRKNGKDDAIYGVFGDDSDYEDNSKHGSTSRARTHWTKAPAFVSSEKKLELEEDVTLEDKSANEEDDGEDDEFQGEAATEAAEYSDHSESSRPPSPRVLPDEEDDYGEEEVPKPRVGGIGFKSAPAGGSTSSGSGFGFKGGIGSKDGTVFLSADNDLTTSHPPTPVPTVPHDGSQPSSSRASPSLDGMPSAFGRASTASNRFKREAFATPSRPANLSASEMMHFSKIAGSFGSRMLGKMGWTAGTGLGVEGAGIVTPIESKLRPQKMGIAFKGFREKTEQSKREAKRRGENVSDEEEDEKTKKMRRKVREAEQKRSDIWKKSKKVKTKVEHKTYEQIIAEAGQESAVSGIGQIIDATGVVPREISSLSEINLNSWVPTNDPTHIPEIRHNIRLIAQSCKSDLDNLALEAKALHIHKSFVVSEEARLSRKIEEEAALISRFQQIQIIANEMSALSKEQSSVYEVSLELFSPLVCKFVDQFPMELEKYALDEVVVAAVAPLVRRKVAEWDPLREPKEFISVFSEWRKALRVRGGEEEDKEQTQVDAHSGRRMAISPPPEELAPMTPFESLLWNVWLPKVRSAINNEWSPEEPQPAVKLYEAWSAFLPPFMRDNILDQLVLPKVKGAMADWNSKRSKVSLRSIVFPWLPFVGLRLEDLMNDARRKIKNLIRTWVPGEDIPDDLVAWREVYNKGEWDTIILKYIIPKLSTNLRTNFRIDPRNQMPYLPIFQQTLLWIPLVRSSILSQVFETEFFPEWLRILHVWLIQSTADYDEVRRWYQEWRDMFPKDLLDPSGNENGGFTGVGRGFKRGLELMHEAMALPSSERIKLRKPDFKKEMAVLALAEENKRQATATDKVPTTRKATRTQEITFKSIVEEYAADHNLLFMPTGKAHAKSRMPLYRISPGEDGGKKGLLVYVLDDAVWASVEKGIIGSEEDEFRAISLDDMVNRAMEGPRIKKFND